jgi:hypothetical protein
MQSSVLATAKVTSQNTRQMGMATWLRNSMEIPRKIRHHSTRKMAR